MYSIKIDVNDTIYDKIMLFLKSVPVKSVEVKKVDEGEKAKKEDEDIVSFFRSSPLKELQFR
jgi:hypothetical protein